MFKAIRKKVSVTYSEEFEKKTSKVKNIQQVYKDTGKHCKKLKHAHQRLVEHQKNFIGHLENCSTLFKETEENEEEDLEKVEEAKQMQILYQQYANTLRLLNRHSEHIVKQLLALQDQAEDLKHATKKTDQLRDAYHSAEKMQLFEQKEFDRNKEKYEHVIMKSEHVPSPSSSRRPTKVPTSGNKNVSPIVKANSPKNKLLKKEFSWQDTKAYADELYSDTINEMEYQEKIFKIKYTKTMDRLFTAIEEYCHSGKNSLALTGSQVDRDIFNEEVKAPTRQALERSKFKALHKKKVKSLDVTDPNSEDMQRLLFGKKRNGTLAYAQKRRSFSTQPRRPMNRKHKLTRNNTHENLNINGGDISGSTAFLDDRSLFEKDLIAVMARDNEHGVVPQFYEQALYYIEHHGLQTVGLFRVPGSIATMQQMIDRANNFQSLITCEDEGYSMNDVAGMVKKYLRQLPVPPVTHQFYDSAIAIVNPQSGLSDEEKANYLRKLLLRLPTSHLYLIQRTLVMLTRVARYSETNKMDLKNLSLVFGLNFLRPNNNNPLITASITPYCNDFVLLMLNHMEVVLDVNDYFDHFGPLSMDCEPLLAAYHIYPDSSTSPEFFHLIETLSEMAKPLTLQVPSSSSQHTSSNSSSSISSNSSSHDSSLLLQPQHSPQHASTSSSTTAQPHDQQADDDVSTNDSTSSSTTMPDEKSNPTIDIVEPTPGSSPQDLSEVFQAVPSTNRYRRSLSQTPYTNSTDFFTNLVRQNIARQEIRDSLDAPKRPDSLVL